MDDKEILLSPGDVLYIPKGIEHDPYTKDNFSLYLTIGVVQEGKIKYSIPQPKIELMPIDNVYLEFLTNIEKISKCSISKIEIKKIETDEKSGLVTMKLNETEIHISKSNFKKIIKKYTKHCIFLNEKNSHIDNVNFVIHLYKNHVRFKIH